MIYAVWYMRPEWFPKGVCYEKPDPNNLEATHVYVRDVEANNDVEAGIEWVWEYMQGHNWSANGEADALIEAKGLTHTSMSVGDVVVADGAVWLCASIGFERL